MKKISFSVITVTYNCSTTINSTIESVLMQRDCDYEYILIDGGSDDGTVDEINAYHDQISVFISEPDTGVYNAMNKGIQQAKGDIICFLNSGDVYIYDHVLADIAKKNEEYPYASIIAACVQMPDYVFISDLTDANNQYFIEMLLPHPGCFVKRDVFERRGGFNESYRFAADYDWLLGTYLTGEKIQCAPDVVVKYCGNGISSDVLCRKEHYEVSMKHMKRHGRYDLEPRIRMKYKNAVVSWLKKCIRESDGMTLQAAFLSICNVEEGVSIWGTGVWCDRLFSLLDKADIDVTCYYDSDPEKQNVMRNGIPVRQYEPSDGNGVPIFIASSAYEEEIAEQLVKMKLERNKDFYTLSQIRRSLLTYYSDTLGLADPLRVDGVDFTEE